MISNRIFFATTILVSIISFQNCQHLDSPSGTANLASLDKTPPDIFLSKAPATISGPSATFEFASTDSSASFMCAFNAEAFHPCTSPALFSALADATYQFQLQAKDAAGNTSPVLSYAWRVDHTVLGVTISSSIPAFTNVRNFSLAFNKSNAAVAVAGFECKVDFLDYAVCVSPYTGSNLNEGDHTVQIRAKDGSGIYSVPAAVSWHIDLSAPVITLTSGPAGNVTITDVASAPATFSFAAQDSGGSQIKTVTCKMDAAVEGPCSSPVTYQINGDGAAHNLVIKVTDNAGNSSSVTRAFSFTTYYTPSPPIDPGGGGGGGDGGV